MPHAPSPNARPLRRCADPSHGFTLIELLVVISIIALLVGLLMPTLSEARESAKVLECLTHTRQIGTAWTNYLLDHDDTFPILERNLQWFYGGKDPALLSQLQLESLEFASRPINPYLGLPLEDTDALRVFQCTDDGVIFNTLDADMPGGTYGHTTFAYFGNSYMMNKNLLEFSFEEDNRPVKLSDVTLSHDRVVLAGEPQWFYTVNDSTWAAPFHNDRERVPMVYLDGHSAYTRVARGESHTSTYSFLRNTPPPEEQDAQAPDARD